MIARRILVAFFVVVMLGVAAFAVATAPDSDRITEPFDALGAVGEPVETRLLDVEVDDVTIASRLDLTYGGTFDEPTVSYATQGVWVVVDVTAATSTDSLILAGSILTVGEYSYSVFSLPAPSIESFTIGSDVPVTGSLVFELPKAVFESAQDARLTLKGNFSMPLEQIAVVALPLGSESVEPNAVVDAATVAGVAR